MTSSPRHGPLLDFRDWCQFLAESSARIGYAWNRVTIEQFSSRISIGVPPKGPIVPKALPPGWSWWIDTQVRDDSEVSESNPAIIRITLKGRELREQAPGFVVPSEMKAVEVLIHKFGESIAQGGGNLVESEKALLEKWVSLLKKHCLDKERP